MVREREREMAISCYQGSVASSPLARGRVGCDSGGWGKQHATFGAWFAQVGVVRHISALCVGAAEHELVEAQPTCVAEVALVCLSPHGGPVVT